ncbi:MAG: methyltransferase FkbM family [Frankiales bacterium]|nr:methyltransferase FkbM family [Frankiales bacterium]
MHETDSAVLTTLVQVARSPSRMRNGLNKRVARLLLTRTLKPADTSHLGLVPVGTGEGQWLVPLKVLPPEAIAYCVGVGVDASLDVALAQEHGCRVMSFDPTPQAVSYMAELAYDRDRLTFEAIGIWNEDAELRLYEPNQHGVNFSVHDVHDTGRFVETRSKRLRTVMDEQGHDRIDLLKLDVEGAWEPILDDMLASGVRPRALCVEFDSPTTYRRVAAMVRRLDTAGLRLVHFAREDYVFVDKDALQAAARG